jgi:hypothetical protein
MVLRFLDPSKASRRTRHRIRPHTCASSHLSSVHSVAPVCMLNKVPSPPASIPPLPFIVSSLPPRPPCAVTLRPLTTQRPLHFHRQTATHATPSTIQAHCHKMAGISTHTALTRCARRDDHITAASPFASVTYLPSTSETHCRGLTPLNPADHH